MTISNSLLLFMIPYFLSEYSLSNLFVFLYLIIIIHHEDMDQDILSTTPYVMYIITKRWEAADMCNIHWQ